MMKAVNCSPFVLSCLYCVNPFAFLLGRRSFLMEGKDSKQYYLFVKGKKVWVEEEVYRAYVRPI